MVVYFGALAVAVGLAVACALFFTNSSSSTGVAHSLALLTQGTESHERARNDASASDRLIKPILDLGRRLAVRLTPAGAHARLTRLLDFAGNPRDWGADRLLAIKGLGLLAGAVFGSLIGGVTLEGLTFGAVLGVVGFYVPDLLVYNLGLRRQEELRLGLADALDMLTVCVEAGQSFDASLQQVAQHVTGPVAGEFARVLQEISIGKSRAAAFSAMSSRTTVPEIKTFVTALVQSDRMGLSIGSVLREQAEQMRLIRRQRGEEMAQKVTVKIMFPMVLCIFPLMFVVLIGPGAMQIMDAFKQANG